MLDEGPHSRSLGMGDGYVPGEGVGAVLLKPLGAALRDGDRIDGILRASFVNHAGGRQKYTVPDPKRQGELVAAALSRARVDIDTIGYVETAANGSPLGDPIEIVALNQAFRRAGRRMAGCAIGAVKSNLGHLEAASGISQLTKVLLQLRHRTLVPTLHADPQNPALPLSDGPFHIQRDVAPWPAPGGAEGSTPAVPRRALVNSFGAGGAYACLVVEEAPPLQGSAETPPPLAGGWPCVVSAATPGSLARWAGTLHEHLSARPTLSLADIACTLDRVDNNLPHRLVLVASSLVELLQQLAAVRDGRGASVPGVLLPETAMAIMVGGDGLLAQLARWVAGERAMRDGLIAMPARPALPLPPYAFDHDHSFRAASASPGPVQPADDHLQAIFERIAQGALSMDGAWNLVQTTEG
jgi:polyketide synthase PksR